MAPNYCLLKCRNYKIFSWLVRKIAKLSLEPKINAGSKKFFFRQLTSSYMSSNILGFNIQSWCEIICVMNWSLLSAAIFVLESSQVDSVIVSSKASLKLDTISCICRAMFMYRHKCSQLHFSKLKIWPRDMCRLLYLFLIIHRFVVCHNEYHSENIRKLTFHHI